MPVFDVEMLKLFFRQKTLELRMRVRRKERSKIDHLFRIIIETDSQPVGLQIIG